MSAGLLETVSIITAALVVLQTRVKFERDKKGCFSLKVEKEPASDGVLREVVKLGRYLVTFVA